MTEVPGSRVLSAATVGFLILAGFVGSLALFFWALAWLRAAVRAFVT